jgi:serine/threonine/tyrosine-interacting protein
LDCGHEKPGPRTELEQATTRSELGREEERFEGTSTVVRIKDQATVVVMMDSGVVENPSNGGHNQGVFSPMDASNSFEWEYHMRREMQEIIPGVFLGPYAAAMKTKLDDLLQNGVTHIICVRQELESPWIRANFPENFQYLTLDIADTITENIIRHFPAVRNFIDDCLNRGGKVLIHGIAGISRSAALVVAYLMEKYNLPFDDALKTVQKKRFCVFLNDGFKQQLRGYEPVIKARGQIIDINGENGLKRKFLSEDDDPFDSLPNRGPYPPHLH